MAPLSVSVFEKHLHRAHEYRESAQWEFVTRELQEAKLLCETQGFPDGPRRRREVLNQLGNIERRLGRYDNARQYLEEVMQDSQTSDALRVEVSGELSVVYRHLNDFAKARDICDEQYQVARRLHLTAEEEMCRAIGNLGMANYQLSRERNDKDLLHLAIIQVQERVERARALQARLRREDPNSKSIRKARTWESIGLDRLTLCFAADGNTSEAVKYGYLSTQMTKDSPDPTIRALSRFFCGYALLRHGERGKAMDLFNFTSPENPCTCAIALCKEPSDEYCQYLKVIVDEGVDLKRHDEQGYSALDYAVFGGNQAMQQVVLGGLERVVPLGKTYAARQLDDANLKKHYREILQEWLRPELSSSREDSIQNMRVIYSKLLAKDTAKKACFDELKLVKYSDFGAHGRLPISTETLAQTYEEASGAHIGNAFNPYVVFISYRWIGTSTKGSSGGIACPDDLENTQYKRMCSMLEAFLNDSKLDPGQLYLWLDWACIDQTHKDPGINTLPVIITQCNAVVSLLDDSYFNRAWCGLEASMIQTLVHSHGQHYWYTHKLHSPETNRVIGHLERCVTRRDINPTTLPLSFESDRPKISFLYKQSILLGKELI